MKERKTIPKSNWKWFGYAGHLIVSSQCLFHLWTQVGKYLISTVGNYCPNIGKPDTDKDRYKMKTIGAGKDSFFETYVFKYDGMADCGCCPEPEDWSEIDGDRSATAIEAQKIHMKYCLKYARK